MIPLRTSSFSAGRQGSERPFPGRSTRPEVERSRSPDAGTPLDDPPMITNGLVTGRSMTHHDLSPGRLYRPVGARLSETRTGETCHLATDLDADRPLVSMIRECYPPWLRDAMVASRCDSESQQRKAWTERSRSKIPSRTPGLKRSNPIGPGPAIRSVPIRARPSPTREAAWAAGPGAGRSGPGRNQPAFGQSHGEGPAGGDTAGAPRC
jgi:hypothetical protein